MEPDSPSHDSDEGVELSPTGDHASMDLGQYSCMEQKAQPSFLEAETIHVLMPKNVSVSRAARFQWFLDHLNTIVFVPVRLKLDNTSTELEIISVIAKETAAVKTNKYLVTSHTQVKFVAHSYRFVYCVDMSPSQSAVNIQKGEILFDEILFCFKSTLEGVCRQFTIPGNSLVFQPSLYLTVIVNTPFFMSPAQQVLVKGVKVTSRNVHEIISLIESQFHSLEGRIAQVSATAHDEIELQRMVNEGIVGTLFHLAEGEQHIPNIPMVLPDANFVNMLRYSMLAISLLPENSLSHILVITDGVVAMPDSNIMESLLLQLHYDSIPVSFLKVGPTFHPHSSAGYVSYTDLLQFLSQCTLGTCLEEFPEIEAEPSMAMNIYHQSYIFWTFQSKSKYKYSPSMVHQNKWTIPNDSFHKNKAPVLLSKRQTEENVTASVTLLFSRRMREGYSIESVKYNNGLLEVGLTLEWKTYIYIQYYVTCQWPLIKNVARVEVHISAPYEFLHDITCLMRKEPKSSYRQAVIERFWLRLTQLSSGDTLLAHQLSSIQSSTVWYTLPESVRSGIPVFILNSNDAARLVLSPSDISCPKFVAVWQPICQIESNNWRKWFHLHKLSVALKYDHPLPRHLHLANSSGRFQVIQCRQAATALYSMLSDWSSFVLIDNHTYLKLLYREQDRPPTWFCIVRVIPKFPCAVINVAFITGTPGAVRHQICEELKIQLSSLSYLSSPIKCKESMCCTLLQKPLERILIRYERMPSDFTTVIFPDGTQPPSSLLSFPNSPLAGTLFTTLSRYLYHKRWIWSTSHTANPKLEMTAVSRILSTLTRMRIKEGFSFAHSSSGIITMVLELHMEPLSNCVIQYVLFPPHRAWREGEYTSGSEEDVDPELELESELQMVTEVWVEPQYGTIQQPTNSHTSHLNNKHYYELADVIREVDLQCINSLLTLEHLSLICQNKSHLPTFDLTLTQRLNSISKRRKSSSRLNSRCSLIEQVASICDTEERIQHNPFNFDPISILPLCQQSELLFSMFVESNERTTSLNHYDFEKSNKLLLENIQDHLHCLHDNELDLTPVECDRFTQQILTRHRNKCPHLCPLSLGSNRASFISTSGDLRLPQWRCFIKGISVTHVILTFIPATLQSLKSLVASEGTNTPSMNDSSESTERASSRGSNFSDVPINVSSSLVLPLYVFDCPLALLVDSYINNVDEEETGNDDVYEDHRFKFGSIIQEDSIRLKGEEVISGSPEPKSDESETNASKSNVKQHCKTVVLAHSKCFVMSLFSALQYGAFVHSSDVQSAMDQCEETVYDIDITYYMQTICGHLKQQKNEHIDVSMLNQPLVCNELKPLHRLIKEKFFDIMNIAFSPVPTNKEFYYCRNLILDKSGLKPDSDDEISIPPSDGVEFKSDREVSSCSEVPPSYLRFESTSSGYLQPYITPLFIHLICTIRYDNNVANTSVKVLPTCLGELIQNIESDTLYLERSNLQVTLDILYLTLPMEVQNVINDYSTKGLRTTSFCSDAFAPSIDSATSDASFTAEFPDPLLHLPEVQRRAIANLRDKIRWLLKDEIATALLDAEPVTSETLNFVTNHVSDSAGCSSCVLDVIDLNFVYGSGQSYEKFLQEFAKIEIPFYKLCMEDELYYISKKQEYGVSAAATNRHFFPIEFDAQNYLTFMCGERIHEMKGADSISMSDQSEMVEAVEGSEDASSKNEIFSQQSDISSINDSYLGTDGGYDEDVSEDDEDFGWLMQLDNKRLTLPNFWLIMKVDREVVTIYFHCRFLELPTTHVGTYLQVQRTLRDAIRDLCKQVNQSLLLQSLNDTRTCDFLLEPDDIYKDWHNETNSPAVTRNTSFVRLKSMDEASDESEAYPAALLEASLKFTPGYFSCPVVWQTQFILHPRLKTGPGKSGFSRGVLALKTVLDKFSVANRNNMFVYQDVKSNVFYLRLQENVQSCCTKGMMIRSNEFEHALVSRSPSIASLPLGPQKSNLTQSQHSIASTNSRESDIRPRVRSFGEKETKDSPTEDTLTLKVHGITEAGEDVRCELVQVLQNRLDDAVLECLSVMLARNAMCPLTPEDVHFLQKPFRLPEMVIRLSVQNYALKYLDSFVHYLRQNILQFLNIPKYTDSRSHYHFKDYSESEQPTNKISDNIFIYNQSQSPSSGSRGICCIALAVIVQSETGSSFDGIFSDMFQKQTYQNIISSQRLSNVDKPIGTYIEFRLWKQGRVNTDNLFQKLCAATSQAMWDIIIEYYLLQSPLCEKESQNRCKTTVMSNKLSNDLVKPTIVITDKEIECSVLLNTSTEENLVLSIEPKIEILLKPIDVPKVLISRRQKRYIPLNSTARRTLLFDDYKEREPKSGDKRKPIKLDEFELGDDGVMTEICSVTLRKWLDFGVEISVPAVRKNSITLTNRHLLNVTIKELQNIVTQLSYDTAKVFRALPMEEAHNELLDEVYVPYSASHSPTKSILVSRNFELWKICTLSHNPLEHPDLINPQVLKHNQKFTPIVTIENNFVPRQKLFWAIVESDKILIYTYNWTKDNVDKLVELVSNIGLWLSVRASVLNSVTAQKLGIFYNQAITRSNLLSSSNPYLSYVGDVECMMKFPRDRTRRPPPSGPISQPMAMLEIFRDTYRCLQPCHNDPVVVFAVEMQELKRTDKKHKDELKKLHSMWQSRTSTCTSMQIQILRQNSRVIHFCHTPLLFLSRWRVQSASTRDHSLSPLAIDPVTAPFTPSKKHFRSEDEENWHSRLCYRFISDYKRYLQTLGFIPLQIESIHKKHGIANTESTSQNSIFYVQKAMLGGILIFTINLSEPFLITKLHAIECSRLQSTNSRTSINQFTLSFLDECDRIKVAMHLHSFTYDFHLRCIHNYISNSSSGGGKVCEGYHLTHFLDDFMKYYNKAPNFARNLVHEETITIKDLTTEGKQLYDYLLSNVEQYSMDVFSMQGDEAEDVEYVLVQIASTPQMSYKDSQDCQHTDDFDVTLIVSRMYMPYEPWDSVLHLKYYLILTSRREIYPKIDLDRKLGKFRTVSSTFRSISTYGKESNSEECENGAIKRNPSESDFDKSELTSSHDSKAETTSQKSKTTMSSQEEKTQSYSGQNVAHSHVEIKQESVNYLGYYSSHEQLMQQLILDRATITRRKIREMVSQGMVDCRTHLLWNKLVSHQDLNHLTYGEFLELKGLAKLENLCDVHPNLSSLLNQPLIWYQGLAKLLLVKYSDQNRTFISSDGNIQHYVILHPRYDGAFMLLSMDLHTSRGGLYAVYRASHKYKDSDICMSDRKALLDGFINCVCFYIWTGLI